MFSYLKYISNFILIALIFEISVSAADHDFEAHSWSFYGDMEIVGFGNFNEPLKKGEAADNTGLAGRFSLGVNYFYRDIFSANIGIVTEGASRYGLLIGQNQESYYGTIEAVDASNLFPVVDTADFKLISPAEHLWIRAGIIRPHMFSKYALPGVLLGLQYRYLTLETWYLDAGKRDRWRRQKTNLKDGLKVNDGVDATFWGSRLTGTNSHITSGLEITMLEDNTPEEYRWNSMNDYWGSIRKDQLGTATVFFKGHKDNFSADLTASVNFGNAESDEDRGNFDYRGKRLDLRIGYTYGVLSLQGRYLFQSGSPFPHPDDENNYREFKGFSYYPPTNSALYDSHYFLEDGPPVLLGSHLTPFYGIPRPNQHSDISSPENLKSVSVSLEVEPYENLSINCTTWLLAADEVYWVFNNKDYFQPSSDLGWELDTEIIWKPFDHMQVKSFLGVFFTGEFYKDIAPYISQDVTENANNWATGNTIILAELGTTFWL